MKKKEEILDAFGEKVISYVYDDNIKYLKNVICGNTKWEAGKEYTQVFQKLNTDDQDLMVAFFKKQLETGIFSFLSIFEETEEFKLVYQEDNIQINLVEISEMLKAEPIIEGGWIERFSKEIDKEDLL